MAHSVTVNVAHTIVGGAHRRAGEVVTVSNDEYAALTAAGRFTDNTLTDGGGAGSTNDAVQVQGAHLNAPAALTSAVAAGATPTKAEYDALRADVVNLRTQQAALITALTGPGKSLA